MKINIETISHSDQRYPTVGDWWFTDLGDLEIRISSMGNWRTEFLVALHELIEVALCKHRGISQESVDEFDKEFERMRDAFPRIVGDKEPGNSALAPYRKEHRFASIIEAKTAKELDVDWDEYDKAVNSL